MSSRYGTLAATSDINDVPENRQVIVSNKKKIILGVVLSILSGFLFTANNFILNLFHIVVSDAVLVRCFIQTIIYSIIILYTGDKLLPEDRKKRIFTVLQGVLGAVRVITCFASVIFMPVPDALCIIFSGPVVTIILSVIILGDKITGVKCVSASLLLIGVIFVCQPPFLFLEPDSEENLHHTLRKFLLRQEPHHEGLYYVGVLMAVTGCITGGFMDVFISKCQGVSTSVLVNWSSISGLLIILLSSQALSDCNILSSNIVNISLTVWLILIGLAFSGLLAFTFMTAALKLIPPSIVSSLRTSELVVAYTVQTLITGLSPDPWSMGGGCLILTGVILLALENRIEKLRTPVSSYQSLS